MIHTIIPVHNRLDFTKKCLNSLKRQKNFKELNIILVDDGSTDGTSQYVKKKFPKVTILSGNGNLFWGGAVNIGIRYALDIGSSKDWVLLLNNDIELSSDAIKKLVKTSNIKKRKALVASLTVCFDDKKTLIKSGTIVKSWFLNITHHPYVGKNIQQIFNKNPIKVDLLTARCLLHPIEIFKRIGNYDAKNFPHYGGDDDFSIRASKINYSKYICPESIIYLKLDKNNSINKKNLKYFIKIILSKKSSSNLKDKLNFTIKCVPIYAMISFFLIGVLKSFLLSFKKI
jgi:GT2 family glycosyltransferase